MITRGWGIESMGNITTLFPSAYTGRFCNEDLDGCTEVICFDGVECTDVAAPGEGAICGPCPTGHSGNGLNCMGKYNHHTHTSTL